MTLQPVPGQVLNRELCRFLRLIHPATVGLASSRSEASDHAGFQGNVPHTRDRDER